MEIFLIFSGLALAYFIYQVVRKGGFKGAILGSKITQTLGEIALKESGFSKVYLRVHKLENGKVGIELTSKAPFGFSMNGFSLNQNQLDQLVLFLNYGK